MPCRAEDESCPPFQHSMHTNRSLGAQACQKDAPFPSAARGAYGGTAASGQAQVDPSPLGPTEDVSFPPHCCSAFSGQPSGMQFPRKTELFHTPASSAAPFIPDSLQESCARAEDVSCPPAHDRLHSNRSPGTQVYRKDASSPSDAQGAHCMAAGTGQAQVNPSPLGLAEDVSFPPPVPFLSQCRSVSSQTTLQACSPCEGLSLFIFLLQAQRCHTRLLRGVLRPGGGCVMPSCLFQFSF